MGNVFTKVRFSRCREVMASRSAAMIHLREKEFAVGEPALVNYYEDSNASINTIMAVGIKDGKGSDCFRIITLGQYEIVWGVGRELPDVSNLTHNELYLYQDENDAWWYVSAPDGIMRITEPLLPYPQTFINIANNTIYVSDFDKRVRSINDVYTKSEIDALLSNISEGEFPNLASLEQRLNDIYTRITSALEENMQIIEAVENVTEALDTIQNLDSRVSEIEEKVSSLEVNNENETVSGTFSSITFSDSPGGETIILSKNNIVTTENIENYIGGGGSGGGGGDATAIPLDVLNEALT